MTFEPCDAAVVLGYLATYENVGRFRVSVLECETMRRLRLSPDARAATAEQSR